MYMIPKEVMLEELEHMSYPQVKCDPHGWIRERMREEGINKQQGGGCDL